MEFKKLEWDTNFFGFSVGDTFVKEEFSEPIIIDSNEFVFFQVRSVYDLNIFSTTHLLSYFETKVVFSKVLYELKNFEDNVIDFDIDSIEEDLFYELAYESGKQSRYKNDEKMPRDKFKELYQIWIKNSINKSFADKIFYIKEKGKVLGFVTVKINNEVAQIGLIAVLKNLQNMGYGKKLLLKAEKFCFENGIKVLEISTQMENIIASKFYSRMGYEISEKIIIKHYWGKK